MQHAEASGWYWAVRRAAKVDANHACIVAALCAVGAAVTSLAAVADGVPDLLVSYRQHWFLLEVKDGDKAPSRRKLRPAQVAWHARQHAPVHVVKTAEEALQAIGATSPPLPPRWQADHVS